MPSPDDHLIERCQRSDTVFEGNFLHVQRDQVALPDGKVATREFIRHPGAVMIVPLLDDGRLLMERQYPLPYGPRDAGVPRSAGKLDAGEPPFECAVRELEEETGYRGTRMGACRCAPPAIACSDEGIEIYFARGLSPGASTWTMASSSNSRSSRCRNGSTRCADGRVTDARHPIGLLWLHTLAAGEWVLNWFRA